MDTSLGAPLDTSAAFMLPRGTIFCTDPTCISYMFGRPADGALFWISSSAIEFNAGSGVYYNSLLTAQIGLTVGGGTFKVSNTGTAVKNHLSGACTPSAGACSQIADTSAATTSACIVSSTATGGTSPCYCTVAAGVGFTPNCPGTTTAPISYTIEDQ